MKKNIAIFIVFLFVTSGFSAYAGCINMDLGNVVSGQKSANLSEFIGKKPVLLVFFYPQCPPCEKESKTVNKIYEKYSGKLLVIGISLSKDRYDIEDFIDNFKIKYPVYRIVKKGQLRNVGGILATPTSMIIDKNGKIVKKVLGAHSVEKMSKIIEKYIN